MVCNADMRVGKVLQIRRSGRESHPCREGINELVSAQGHRMLKLARTIADLTRSDQIQTGHLAEALQYRLKS